MKNSEKPLIVLGGGGHARVLISALKQNGCSILGITDPDINKHGSYLEGISVIGDDSILSRYAVGDILLVNGRGSVKGTHERRLLFENFKRKGFSFAQVIHPAAVISPGIVLGEGVQVMAGAVIQPGCDIGENSLVNTKASIDHDCKIGMMHTLPGSISGNVTVDDNVHLGCGATVIHGIRIGEGSIIEPSRSN